MSKVKDDVSRVRLEVDGKQAINQLGNLEMEAKGLQIDMKNAKKGTEEYVAANKKLREVEANIKKVRGELGLTGMTMTQLTRYQRDLRKELTNTTTAGTQKYKELRQELLKVNRTISDQRKEIGGSSGVFAGLGKTVGKVAGAFGLLLGGTELIAGFKKLIGLSADFEQSMSNLSAITGATGNDLKFLETEAKNIGATTTFTASQAAKAFELIASKKPELLESKEALVEVSKAAITLAEAAGIDLPAAADALTNTMNQFGAGAEEANKFINALAAGSKFGAGDIEFLNDAIKRFGPIAKAMNLSFEESVAMMEVFAEKGLESEKAGIQFRNILVKLASGADETNPAIVGMDKAIENLGKQQLNTAELAKMFGNENLVAAQIMVESGARFQEFTGKVTGTSVALEQARIRVDNFNGLMKEAQSIAEYFGIAFGRALQDGITPFLRGIVDAGLALKNFLNPAEAAVRAFEDQSIAVDSLNKQIDPLLKRYEELKGKTNLSNTEQEEMKMVIQEIARLIPTAATGFDEYGNAIDISTSKVEAFRKAQIEANKILNAKAISETKKELADLEKQIQTVNNQFARRSPDGDLMKIVNKNVGFSSVLTEIKMTGEEIAALQEKLKSLQEQAEGRRLGIAGLTGEETPEMVAARVKAAEAARLKALEEAKKLMGDDNTDSPIIPGPTEPEVQRYADEIVGIWERLRERVTESQKFGVKDAELVFDEMRDINEKFNVDMAEFVRQRAEDEEKARQQSLQDEIDIANAKVMIAQGLSASIGATIDIIGNKSGELTSFQKMLAISQIAIDSAVALGKIIPLAVAAAAKDGPLGAFTFAGYIASMAGTVLSAVARAKSVLSDSNVPQWNSQENENSGGTNPVSRRGGTSPRRSFYYGGPTGEGMGFGDRFGEYAGYVHKSEYVVPQIVTSDPWVANVLPIIESIRQDKIRGFASGGPSSSGAISTQSGGMMSDPEVKELLRMMVSKLDAMPTKMRAYLVYNDLEEMQEEAEMLKSRFRA
jgi:TP901 family phage tail tape measure protein